MGLLIVLAATFMSGFAGVYFELVLKKPSGVAAAGQSKKPASIWVRNIQLATFSIILGLFTCWTKDGDKIAKDGFFQNYRWSTLVVIALTACGGILVALVVKYADNILKGFATAVSIVISAIVSAIFMDFEVTQNFCLGTVLVLTAVFLYGYPTAKTTPPTNATPATSLT